MRAKILEPIGILTILLVTSAANGAVFYSQTPTITGMTTSDLDASDIAASQFSLTSSDTVRSVAWKGRGGVISHAQDFTISFFADNSGTVGTLLGAFNVGAPASQVDTGQNISADSVFAFTADLGPGISLSSGANWVSIHNNTVPDVFDDDWLWAKGNTGGGTHVIAQSANGGASWANNPNLIDFDFSLNNANVVPIPPAAWLFGSALGLIGFLRRRGMPCGE